MANIVVLDGGFSTTLEAHGHDLSENPLWGSDLAKTHPDAVKAVHKDFLASGSDIISTCTYQASIDGFTKHLNITTEEAKELIKKSVALAKSSCEEFWKQVCADNKRTFPKVAGSVGPYGVF